MATYDYDLFTIGAGSGGVRASRVAAAHGAKVAVAEEYRVGGTCVIRGCVPKKLLVYGAHFAEDLQDAKNFGWTAESCTFDWKSLRDNVLKEVDRLNGLYRQALESHKVDIIEQRATVTGPHEVTLADGTKKTAKYILVCTGARPHVPGCPGHELGITSNEAFHLDDVPKRILISGAGYIANEFAGIFNEFGAKVTLINRSDQLLRGYDESMRDRLLQISTMKGIVFRFNAEFRGIHKTSLDSIYAIGDVTNRIQLTPVAIREGQAFADTVFGGKPAKVDYSCVPSAVFSHPPIAGVGMTEGEARNKLGVVKVYQSDFRSMKNVLAGRNERSLYKLVCDGEDERIVGIHMISPDAPEILQAAAVAVKAGLTKADFDATVAIHPTMAEELVLMR